MGVKPSLKYLLPGLFLLFGCAPALPGAAGIDPTGLQWPPPPQEARIEWLQEIRDYGEIGRKTVWSRLADLLTGGQPAVLVRPYGVHSDGRGRLLVADAGAARVLAIDFNRQRTVLIDGGEELRLQMPIGIAGDGRGLFYLTDSALGMVFRYDPAQDTLTRFLPHRLERPTGIAFNHRDQLLYVSDTAAHQIVVFDPEGLEVNRIGSRGTAPGQFNFPTDLHVDRHGRLFVTDALNHRIQILTPGGEVIGLFGKEGDAAGFLAKPKGVAVDSDGHIYVVDTLMGSVQIFDDSGRLLLAFGGNGVRPGEFWMPTGISIDDRDDIYVTDTYNRRIQVFRYLGPHPPAAGSSPTGREASR